MTGGGFSRLAAGHAFLTNPVIFPNRLIQHKVFTGWIGLPT